MAPKLSEDEIDDLIYFARAGENDDLKETVAALAAREGVTPAEILVAAKDEGNKSTTLHMATGNGHLETVRIIVSYFDDRPTDEKKAFLDDANEHGNTGLHWAALGGHLEAVKLLVEQGATPALANERNYVPLDLAQFGDKTAVADYFLSFLPDLEKKHEEAGLQNAMESADLKTDKDSEDKDEKPSTS